MNKNISYVALLFFQLFVCNEFQALDKQPGQPSGFCPIQNHTSDGESAVEGFPRVKGFGIALVPYCSKTPQISPLAEIGAASLASSPSSTSPLRRHLPTMPLEESSLAEIGAASSASSPSSTSPLRRHSPTMPLEGRSPSPLARLSGDEFRGNGVDVDPRALADSVVVPSTGIVAPTPQPAFARTVQTIQGHQVVCCGCFGNK